jgi:hypothetical protein
MEKLTSKTKNHYPLKDIVDHHFEKRLLFEENWLAAVLLSHW